MHTLATVSRMTFTTPSDDRTVDYRHSQGATIGEILLQSILLEVCSHPKPGLVSPRSNGSHSDMNLQTFLLSSSAIAPCFTLCAEAGIHHQGHPSFLLQRIRPIGIDYERRLLAVTQGVNTQRGILFSGSVLAAAAGRLYGLKQPLEFNALSQGVSHICQDLCLRDFAVLNQRPAKTAGERLFTQYGVTGIRGEAEQGLPTVMHVGLPALIAAFDRGLSLSQALIDCLLSLISQCDDTNVLWRAGPERLAELKLRAMHIVSAGGLSVPGGEARINALSHWCCQHRISPGGSADLLALTIATYLLCHSQFPNGVM